MTKRISFSKAGPVTAGKGWSVSRRGGALPVRVTAFDPALPVDGSLIVANELRGQFNGLKELIDAIVSVNDAVVDGVSTLLPWDPAQVSVSVVDNVLRFSFGIPQGYGGGDGPQGPEGPPGPPFAQAVVDSVTTLPPGAGAEVSVWFDGTNVHFSFSIPQGYPGEPGEQGPPGEVTAEELNNAIQTTSANSNGVAPLGMVVSDPPTQAEVQSLADKVDELIAALRR